MKDVRIRLMPAAIAGVSQHGVQARIPVTVVIAFLVEREGGNGVDAHTEQIVAASLEDGDYVRSALRNLGQKIGIAGFLQDGLLLFGGAASQVVHVFGVEANDVPASLLGKRSLGEEFPVRNLPKAGHQTIFSERLPVEKHPASQLQRGIQTLVIEAVELLHIDAQVGQQTLGLDAVERWAFNRLRAVTEQRSVSGVELFPRGVPAEIVVRFKNQ